MKEWLRKHLRWLFAEEQSATDKTLQELASEERQYKNSLDFATQQLADVERELQTERVCLQNTTVERDFLKNKLVGYSTARDVTLTEGEFCLDFSSNPCSAYDKLQFYEEKKTDMKIKFKKTEASAVIPVKLKESEPGYSLFLSNAVPAELGAGGLARANLGFALDIPKGYVGKIHALPPMLAQSCVYIFDSLIYPGDTKPVHVSIYNWNKETSIFFKPGQRIATLLIEKVLRAEFVEDEVEVEPLLTPQDPRADAGADLTKANGYD
jgi:dUTPase